MARRIWVVAAIATLFGFASLPAEAQSARTFYIDYANGSNGNSGTSKTTPWKTHPYMQAGSGCTSSGSAPAYSHQAGDQFIFKGGVTWPAACFGMAISSGGSSSSVRDYYGVDQTYFSGGTFSRPIFDMAGSIPSGGPDNALIYISASFLTIEYLEMKNMGVVSALANSSACGGASISANSSGAHDIDIQHMFIHDWTQPGMAHGTTSAAQGTICGFGSTGNVNAYYNTMSDQNGPSNPAPFGGCFRNMSEVAFNACQYTAQGEVGILGPIHDNNFDNLTNASASFDSAIHTNTLETLFNNNYAIYNNQISNNTTAVIIDNCPQSGPIYNNVFWNNPGPSTGLGAVIQLDGGGTCTTNTSNSTSIYNNTMDCNAGGAPCIRTVPRSGINYGTVNLANNQFIVSGTTACISGCGGGTLVSKNNVTMTPTTAASQGYTSSNKYAPTSSSGATVGHGMPLNNLCSGSLAALCSDTAGAPWYGGSYVRRPSGTGVWDAGAYQFDSQSSSKPNPPLGLVAVVQ